MVATRTEKALESIARSLEEIKKNTTPRSVVISNQKYGEVTKQPATLAEDIPVVLEGVSPELHGDATFARNGAGYATITINVQGEDADILEQLIQDKFYEKLHIASVAL